MPTTPARIRHDDVLAVQQRLTPRDRLLLDWLADHQILTTPQITTALFGRPDLTQRRLLTLHHLGLVERFRPLRMGGGTYPWHHVLGPLGAHLVAATRDEPAPRPSAITHRIRRIAANRTLDHLLGINTFFTDLAGHARTHPAHALERWWPETRCAEPGAFAPGLITPIRPDAHGTYTDGRRRLAFFLEYDTGTESHTVLTDKLTRYAVHIARGGPRWPILLRLPTTERETRLTPLLQDLQLPQTIATTTHERLLDTGPARQAWLRGGRSHRLEELLDLAPEEGGSH